MSQIKLLVKLLHDYDERIIKLINECKEHKASKFTTYMHPEKITKLKKERANIYEKIMRIKKQEFNPAFNPYSD